MRTFNDAQRRSLLALADGKCAACGAELGNGFHADHVIPHAAGGRTTIHNGQALCAGCNLRKGKTVTLDIHHPRLLADRDFRWRDWQRNCFAAIAAAITAGEHDFLASVCPAGGKTLLGLEFARRQFIAGNADAVIILVPSDNIQAAWMDDAKAFGYRLLAHVDGDVAELGFVGVNARGAVLTYQWLGANGNAARLLAVLGKAKVIVIADEIHHTADGKPWGKAIKAIATGASFRLGLTGTPFRTDDNAIPFLRYESGKSVPHFEYTYKQALEDKVVVPVLFCWTNGSVVVEATGESGAVTAETWSFDESTTMDAPPRRGRLLTTATSKGSPFLRTMLAAANDELQIQRKADKALDPKGLHAGGLVIAQSIEAAQAAYDYITRILKASAVLVHSELTAAQADIKAFKSSDTEWLVSVAMVSEGVDIPRLRVLAYATNERTHLAFIQAVGRVTRRLPGRTIDEQPVFVHLPKLSDFETYAVDIEKAVYHHVAELAAEAGETGTVAEDAMNDFDAAHARHGRSCPNCGHLNGYEATHCSACGSAMPARASRADRVVINADGYRDGVTLGGILYAETVLDDIITVALNTVADHEDFNRLGRDAWCVRTLSFAIQAVATFGHTPEEYIAKIARDAAAKRAAQTGEAA